MQPVDVKPNTYIDSSKEINNENPKFKIVDIVRISKYKNIFAKCYTRNWSEEILMIKKVKNTLLWANFMNDLNSIQDGFFRGCSRIGGGGFLAPLPKICHTYPTMMKLGTVIPYPKKILKIYESRDTHLEFCWHQHFFTGNQ